MNITEEAIDTLADMATAASAETRIGNVPGILIPTRYQLKEFLERAASPARIQTRVSLHSIPVFLAYYNRYCDEFSTIFCQQEKFRFEAILDFHREGDAPGWCEHRALYACPASDPWKTWTSNSGKWMPQEAFALFIERNLPDIQDPEGARMLEIVTSLQAQNNAAFKRAIRLDNGQVQFQYHEEISGTAGRDGQLTIPTTFRLGLQVFRGETGYQVEAAFRYRITDAKLSLSYELIRPERIAEAAMAESYEQIKTGMTHGNLYHGNLYHGEL